MKPLSEAHRLTEPDLAEARLRLLFERMPVACIVFDAKHRIVEWNPAAELIFGFRREEVLGKEGPQVLLSAEGRKGLEGLLGRLAAGDISAHSVNENVTRDGYTIVCEWHNTPVLGDAGEVIGLVSMAHDVTNRCRAEESLRASEERYRSLVEQVKDYAIFSLDEQGLITSWNQGCEKVLGYAEKEFLGIEFDELFTSADRAAGSPRAALVEAAEQGRISHDRWMRVRNGRRFYCEGATSTLRGTTGRLLGYSVVMRDHTETRLAKERLADRGEDLERLVTERTTELEKATERLRLSERMASLGTLSAGLGHDLGNLLLPLEVRLGALEHGGLPPELAEHIEGIRSCAQYLQRLANGLRMLATDSTRSDAPAATELGEWRTDAAPIFRGVLPSGIGFEWESPGHGCWVAMGKVGLTQAVFNLVQNASDALLARGSGVVRISVYDEPAASVVTLKVSDNGPGMPEGVVRRCLEPNFSTKRGRPSSGMGLSLVHRLITDAGGEVAIESMVNHGTTVSLAIPRLTTESDTRAIALRRAFLDLSDARIGSFIRGVLCTLGFEVVEDATQVPQPSLLVLEPDALARVELDTVPTYRCILLIGDPSLSGSFQAAPDTLLLGPCSDLASISRALRRAAAELNPFQAVVARGPVTERVRRKAARAPGALAHDAQ